MSSFKRVAALLTSCASLGLAACDGAADIASPGTGGNVLINPPATPAPSPTPTPSAALVTPASGCPTIADPKGLTDDGTISGPTGTWRVCTLPRAIARSITLPKVAGLLYQLRDRVDVGCDGGLAAPTAGAPVTSSTAACTVANGFAGGPLVADTNVTLTIEPGVIVYGGTGTSWLAVNRGNKINAVGTATQPVVFTSRDNVLGLANDTSIGQWGGVVLMGRGKITDCNAGSIAANTCERETEGASGTGSATFGGNDDTYNAGTMKYVQIRYSGYVLGANVELQGLTTEGIGSATVLDYIQSHNSSDDGAEFFGGVVRLKHYIATGADDDSLDIDTGIRGAFQYVLMVQRPGQGDALMEVDSNGFEADAPRQNSKIVNFTAIQSQASSNNEANDQASLLLRGNSDITLANGIVISPANECLRMNGSSSGGSAIASLTARSVVFQCNAAKYLGTGSYTPALVAAAFGTGSNGNSDIFSPTLTSLFVNGANESAVPAFDAKTLDAFFDTTNYIGAVRDAADTWYAGWTCNSGYAAFDTTTSLSRSCSSLPTN